MIERSRGRPAAFDRDEAVLTAARLFWKRGYSGTSTRALTSALGLSTSSLYAAFGSKGGLFEEAVKTYAVRYRTIYQEAVALDHIADVVESLLVNSAREFTQPSSDHPGCLVSSAAMTDSADAFDTVAHIAELHAHNELVLRDRFALALAERQIPPESDPAELARLVQAVWHGLSTQANVARDRHELLTTARLAHTMIRGHLLSREP